MSPTSDATPRRPGRPRHGNSQATRERILSAAIDLFGRHGQQGAALRAIAKAADVSLSTVVHHFGDKRALFDACVAATYTNLNTLSARFEEVLANAKSPLEAIRPIMEAVLAFGFEHRRFVRVVVTEAVSSGRVPDEVWARTAPVLDRVGLVLAAVSGRPVAETRLLAMSINHLASRYVLTAPDQLARIVGIVGDGTDGEGAISAEIFAALVDHLTATALRLLGA